MSKKRINKTRTPYKKKVRPIKSPATIKKILFGIPEDGWMKVGQMRQWREYFRRKFKGNKQIVIPTATHGYDVVDFIWNNSHANEQIQLMVGRDGRIVITRYAFGEIIDRTEKEFKKLETIIKKIKAFKPSWVIRKGMDTQSFTLNKKQTEAHEWAKEHGDWTRHSDFDMARRIYLEGLAKKKKLKIPQ